ncbi:hypothetical protein [Paraliomyxa miuraensis]|uniref:hypothetical protein n=1 Tax=Paraliomyxa miuraensis TaxID=376150 RepID=UPI00224E8E84|nr:hypothetical protein [Paraliomyxa miuraensis]MCX4243258.1 hypothetical protein [Paraliomyxa miuraensis]
MRIIETCPALSASLAAPGPEPLSAACVSDPLHAIAGSWLGPVVQPPAGPGGPAPRPSTVVRCDELGWR